MKKVVFFCGLLGFASACITTRNILSVTPQPPEVIPDSKDITVNSTTPPVLKDTLPEIDAASSAKKEAIIETALSYNGTRYRYGGTTREGMDCSGLVHMAFKTHEVPLERSSHLMALQGHDIDVSDVRRGDLVFFITNGGSRINHVGLVVTAANGEVSFIHATTSRGVLISSLKEAYWNTHFIKVRRVL